MVLLRMHHIWSKTQVMEGNCLLFLTEFIFLVLKLCWVEVLISKRRAAYTEYREEVH